MKRERCNSFWFGPALGPVERACFRSALRQGHPLTLWCYDEPAGVPEGVEVADAADVLPRARIIRHKNGSIALFANWFRYELQRRGAGIWIDADLYLLRPIPAGEYLLAREPIPQPAHRGVRGWLRRLRRPPTEGLNNSVLRVPADSPLLPPLIDLFAEKKVPAWLPPMARIAAYWRLVRTGKTGMGEMPWGVAGPKALTAVADRLGLSHLALPTQCFHAFSWAEADWILRPYEDFSSRISEATIGIHLWNERIKGFKEEPAPDGSFLARLQAEGR